MSWLKEIAHLCWTSSVHTPKLNYILAVYNVDVPNVDVYNVDVPNFMGLSKKVPLLKHVCVHNWWLGARIIVP